MRSLAAAWLLVAGCDWSLHRMQEPVGCREYAATTLLPGGTCDQPPPEGTVAMTRTTEPPPITRALVERGRDRFERFCAGCHGLAGDGDSYIARAMTVRRPPSLVDDIASKFPDDRITFVMAKGYGLMPSYAWVPEEDRFAILQYVRVLQHSVVALDALPATDREEAKRWLP